MLQLWQVSYDPYGPMLVERQVTAIVIERRGLTVVAECASGNRYRRYAKSMEDHVSTQPWMRCDDDLVSCGLPGWYELSDCMNRNLRKDHAMREGSPWYPVGSPNGKEIEVPHWYEECYNHHYFFHENSSCPGCVADKVGFQDLEPRTLVKGMRLSRPGRQIV